MDKQNYWIVGATHDKEDMYDEFINNGFWYMGWEHDHSDNHRVDQFFKRVENIKENDRIAIKRLMGQGSSNIKILAIGIVLRVEKEIVYVNWLVKGMDREVPINGCIGTIYGPYTYDDEWVNSVFCI